MGGKAHVPALSGAPARPRCVPNAGDGLLLVLWKESVRQLPGDLPAGAETEKEKIEMAEAYNNAFAALRDAAESHIDSCNNGVRRAEDLGERVREYKRILDSVRLDNGEIVSDDAVAALNAVDTLRKLVDELEGHGRLLQLQACEVRDRARDLSVERIVVATAEVEGTGPGLLSDPHPYQRVVAERLGAHGHVLAPEGPSGIEVTGFTTLQDERVKRNALRTEARSKLALLAEQSHPVA